METGQRRLEEEVRERGPPGSRRPTLKKRFTIETNNLHDIISQLEQKLQGRREPEDQADQEVNVPLIKDVEHSQIVIKEVSES